MPDSSTFEFVCRELERLTSLDKLEARGTVRLALKEGGLDPRSVAPREMAVVLEKLLPRELESRGVEDSMRQCQAICSGLSGLAADTAQESPEDVFRRLGGGA